MEVVKNNKHVNYVVSQNTLDKFISWKKLKYDIMFVGDDWYDTKKWQELDKKFKKVGVRIVYLPYTKGTSSTIINNILNKVRK